MVSESFSLLFLEYRAEPAPQKVYEDAEEMYAEIREKGT